MLDLSARQIQILRAIIEEYIETAEPVGSDTIDKKFQIGVSPATIRNEMVYLTKQGYLAKIHSSAGRSPTPKALRLYVNELMKEKELSVADEISAKEKVWRWRQEVDQLLLEATRVSAQRTRTLAIALRDERHLQYSGYANLLQMPEFCDIDSMRHVLTLIEEVALLEEIFNTGTSASPVHVVYGQELGNQHLNGMGIIYTEIIIGDQRCQLGVIGSSRFQYDYVIPLLKYFRHLLVEVANK